jgi:hypothetical protein
MDTYPSSIPTPVARVNVDGLPSGEVTGQASPGEPFAQDLENGVHNRQQIGARAFAMFRGRQQGFKQFPLLWEGYWDKIYTSLLGGYRLVIKAYIRRAFLFYPGFSQISSKPKRE